MAEYESRLRVTADTSGARAEIAAAERSVRNLGKAAADVGKDSGAGMEKLSQNAQKAGENMQKAGEQAGKGMEKMREKADESGKAIDRATRQAEQSFERLQARMQTSGQSQSDYLANLAKQRGANMDYLAPMIEKIKALEAAQKSAAASSTQLGMSTAQMTAALRNVPAQMTDIVVSLQGGQKPMTVLLQQGGQLKDMFGGVGAAAKAVGGYVMGMINPFTVAAAAVVTLATAYYKGSQESGAFEKALILSGNAAGTTASQMVQMADAIGATGRSRGAAVEALTAVASSGDVASGSLQKFAQVAMDMERASGQAVSKTAEQFAELGRAPTEASAKLNEQTKYLTASVYEQIKALENQGRTTDAARLAQETYANALGQRANDVIRNAGLMERAWHGVTTAAGNAWQAMLNIGKAQTNADKLADVNSQLARLQNAQANTGFASNGGGAAFGRPNPGADNQRAAAIAQLQAQRAALMGVVDGENAAAKAQAERQKVDQAGIQWSKNGEKYLTDKTKMERELAQARQLGTEAGKSQADIEKRLGEIRASYEKKGSGGSKSGVAPGENEVARIRAMIKEEEAYAVAIDQRGAAAEKLTSGEKLVLQIQQQLETGLKGVARANKEAALAEAQKLAAVQLSNRAAQQQAEAIKASQDASAKQVEDLFKSADAINAQADQMDAANAVWGKGKVAVEEYRLSLLQTRLAEADSSDNFIPKYVAALNLVVEAQKHLVQSTKDTEFKRLNQSMEEGTRAAQEQLKLLEEETSMAGATSEERARIVALRKVELEYAKRLAEIDRSGVEGAERDALREQADQERRAKAAAAVAQVAQAEWQKTADSINQSLTDALLRGFESGKGFAKNFRDTLKNMFRTLVLRPIISFIVQPIGNAISAVINGFLGGGAQGGGMLGNLLSGASNGSSLLNLFSSTGGNWGAVSGFASGGMSFANTAGSIYANTTGTGISGLLSTNGAYGTAPGASGGAGGLSGLATGVAVVAIPLIIGALAERASRDRIGGAAYASSDPRKDPVAGAGSGTRYDPATGQLPEYQAMVDRLVELGYGQTQEWYARFKGNERALYMLTQLVESEAAMGAERFSHVNPQDMIDRYGDFYRGAGAADPQAMGWWNWKGNEGASVDPAAITLSRTVAQSIVGPLTSLSELIGGAADDLRVSVGYAQRGPGKGVWAGMRVERNGETVSDWTNTDDYHSVGEAVQGMYSHALEVLTTEFDLPQWAQNQATAARAELDKLSGDDVAQQSATLYNNTTANIAQTFAAIQQLIDIFPTFSDATQDTVHALAEAAGGMDKLSASYASYVSHFYSASEQQAFGWAQIQSVLGKVNLLVPATRDGFRELVESLDLSTEAGRNAFNALMQVESAFYNLTEAAEGSADTMGMTKDSVKGMFASILSEAQSAAEARQMAEEAAGEMVMNAISDAMINSIMGPVMDSIVAPMVASITAGATTGGAALASGGAMGGTAVAAGGAAGGGAVAAGGAQGGGAVAAGGASAGSSMAAGGGAAGASVASALQQVRTTLGAMTQVFSSPEFAEMYRAFTGAMGEIGAGLFGSMDAVAMAVGGGGSAGGGGGQGQAPSGKAVDELAEALKRLGKTVSDEVKRLRGLINDESDFGLAYLKAQFATATAQARAGDLDALGKLTGLSKSIDDMTKATAMSEIENVRNRAWLADSLEATLNSLGLKLEDFEKSGGPTVGDTSGLSQSTPNQGADIAAVVRTVTVSGNADLLLELKALNAKVAALEAAARDTANNTNKLPRMSDQFDNVTEGGNAIRAEVMNETLAVEVQP